MKKIFIPLLPLFFLCGNVNSQTYFTGSFLKDLPPGYEPTFWDIQKAFNEHWEDKEISDTECVNGDEGGYEQFKRWEAFVGPRTYPSGKFYSSEILYNEYQKLKTGNSKNKTVSTQTSNWNFIGPANVIVGSGGNGGAGRINCITTDPTNPNIIWAGAACGGLWNSTNGGLTWSSNTDLLPALSISDIAINPSNPNEMYLATGDKYGEIFMNGYWGGTYSAGVMKSTNGGTTWTQSGLTFAFASNLVIQRLIIDPTNTNTLYAATSQGIYKTINAGNTWINILNGIFFDIEMNPGSSNILYAATQNGATMSTDGGLTWNVIAGVTGSGARTSIVVTAANPQVVYIWTDYGNFYYSNNSGITFTVRGNPNGAVGGYGWYDLVLEASQSNENVLVAAGYDIGLSTDGGNTWVKVSDWNTYPNSNYVHCDQHALKFAPGSSTLIYSGSDGGVNVSNDQGTTWNDISNGLHIKQYYRLSSSHQNTSVIYAGAQDNGTDKLTGLNTGTRVYGADGEDCFVDFVNDSNVYISKQNGTFLRSYDQGNTFTYANVTFGAWTSPMTSDPVNPQTLYVGEQWVKKSTDRAATWTNITTMYEYGGYIAVEVSNSAPNTLYISSQSTIHRTNNGGTTWTDITPGLPVNNCAITGIAISGTDSNSVWVSFSGFHAGNKVFYTNNGGLTWVNVSGSLPNVPVDCIEYQNGTADRLYIGTDLGVFYIDATMNNWQTYNTGLPNVIVNDVEIYTPTNKLRAATFGRGIWETDLQTSTLQNLDASALTVLQPTLTTCNTSITPQVRIRNSGNTTITSVKLYYKMDAQPIQVYNWSGTLTSLATADITLTSFILPYGNHTLKTYTSDPNLGIDQNTFNDTIAYNFQIYFNTGILPPIVEGFVPNVFPPANWTLENSTSIWSRSTAAGGYGTSSESATASFYNVNAGQDYLNTPYVDFSIISPPIRLYFDRAYAPYFGQPDSLIIELYSDCDNIPIRVYAKGPDSLATRPYYGSPYIPLSTEWKTDTVDLDSYSGYQPMQIRFMAKTGSGNNLFIDNINLTHGNVGVEELHGGNIFTVSPNPSNGIFTISCPNEISQINIYNTLGEKIFSSDKHDKKQEIDLSSRSNGIYFAQVMSNNKMSTKKIVVR